MRLRDKVAVVTGAGSGFGAGMARRFAAEGAAVVCADIDAAAAERVAETIVGEGGSAVAIGADVTRGPDVAAMIGRAGETWDGLDIVVSNAGVTHRNGPMEAVEEAEFDRVMAVNVKSLFWAAKHALPVFDARGGGVFLNIASTASVRPRPGLTWYNGSKGAAAIITRSMAVELAARNIRVNGINPVLGRTGLTDLFVGDNRIEDMAATIPLGRLSTAEDVAAAAVYLCSDEAAFITGVCLEVDGGRCI